MPRPGGTDVSAWRLRWSRTPNQFIVVDDGAGFARRVAVGATRDSRQLNNDQISAVLGTQRQFSRKLAGRFEFRYRYQYRRRDLQASRVAANFFLLNVRLDYQFAPVNF